jgi:hypothetical protein
MLGRIAFLLVFIIPFTMFGPEICESSRAQNAFTEFKKLLREQAAFEATDFAELEQGETVVKLLPVQDKREVAVYGVVFLQTPLEVFLESYREGLTRKNNPAILEIGKFSKSPTFDDLRSLTIETRDIDDMKDCVVGKCDLKLSAAMIERFHSEVNWDAPDYRVQASQLIKLMLLQYVQEYIDRGDSALIEYSDKEKQIRLGEEVQSLMAASRYLNGVAPEFTNYLKSYPRKELPNVEHALVWSKLKFGLKPVIAINHVMIYRREQETGPQVLIATKQIYANHYFNSSLALTAFGKIPERSSESYLLYENRSRADGLEGFFSGMRRRIVQNEAADNLKTILQGTKVNLEARALNPTAQFSATAYEERRPTRWSFGGIHVFWWLFWIMALLALLGLSAYDWNRIRREEASR